MRKKALELANKLREAPRDDDDLLAAKMLEQLSEVYELSCEMVRAKTNEHSRAAYSELVDLIKGKKGD